MSTATRNDMPLAHPRRFNAVDWIALLLVIVGALNWGLVGAINLDLVATLFGAGATAARAVYLLVALAGLYAISIPFRMSHAH